MSEEAKADAPKTLHQKLLAIQKHLQYFQKANKNQQQGFHYVSSSQVVTDLRVAMDEQGVLLKSEIIGHEARLCAVPTKSSAMHWTGLAMRFTWIDADNPADREECLWYAEGLDNSEKASGKAATYAEKYFAMKFFHVPSDQDDPDAWEQKHVEEEPAPPAEPESPAFTGDGYPLTTPALAAYMQETLGIDKSSLGSMRKSGADLAWGGPPDDWKALTEAQIVELAKAIEQLVNGEPTQEEQA